jgi:hypothetical protein
MDVLEKEITGGPFTVTIRGTARPLAYSMYAVILYKQKTGDSLFDPASWPRIDLQQDPARWMACLWAGMHEQQADKSWKAPFTIDELGGLIGFDNAGEISVAMVKALTQYMPKAKEQSSPKMEAPAGSEATPELDPPASTSPSSTPGPVAELVLAGPNS